MSEKMPEIEPLPRWIQAELDHMPDPPDEELARYDSIKTEFLRALSLVAAAKAPKRSSDPQRIVDAVFGLAGNLLCWAEGQVSRLTEAAFSQSVALTTRGPETSLKPEAGRGPIPISRVRKDCGDFYVEAATYKTAELVEIEVNFVRRKDGAEVRPFDVAVTDQEGHLISGPVHVGDTGQAPRFPGPTAGVYRFLISWAGGSSEIQIEFR